MNLLKILRYIALILGFQASAYFTFFLVPEGGADLFAGKISVIPIMLMMILSIGGFIWAVMKPLTGSLVMIAGGAIMAIYLLIVGGLSEFTMSLIFGLPFIIPGLIFYFTSKKATATLSDSIL